MPPFDAVFQDHFAHVRRTLKRLGAHPHDAEDLAQDVFLIALGTPLPGPSSAIRSVKKASNEPRPQTPTGLVLADQASTGSRRSATRAPR